ncbi:preprotein translocase subunit SecE [Pajaroellobacter abortibovis]|uniref:Preprotein translocase subunit SecE n=1 Tax=Pajaroellobacter abortibovis TaxID=1882918 RepID=A0A1L6MY58_9BACT|nr:preprotein translocase subunit SecE [Pajaroellobacter abortibovis]APS00442.1 preprotein translocase subunit SecE [Pajaroellobacter abortibovis]
MSFIKEQEEGVADPTCSEDRERLRSEDLVCLTAVSPVPLPEREEEEREYPFTQRCFRYRKFVYSVYFAGGMGVAFLIAKIGKLLSVDLSRRGLIVREITDEWIVAFAISVGILTMWQCCKRATICDFVNSVANELSQVTWPPQEEVAKNTIVVVAAAALATFFFAVMDHFWGLATNLVYSG